MILVLLCAEGAASATPPRSACIDAVTGAQLLRRGSAKGIQHGYPPALPGVSLPMRDYYRIECCTAEGKRTLGYCCLPIPL
ncbi:MAG: hypothetical protein KKH61_19240 [Gammaproteobacteria bacterium]|nr:hypothetical protein [Gammaproteobacteria bacterium]